MNVNAKFILAVAKAIANDLFRNGNGEVARRLVLELPRGRDGGDWQHFEVIDLVAEQFEKAAPSRGGKK